MITFSNLTSGGGSGGTSQDTASISPSANKIILVAVGHTRSGSDPAEPTVSGCGMTWTKVTTVVQSTDHFRVTVFRGVSASPSAGALTINVGSTIDQMKWSVEEVSGCKITGTNGSDAIVQSTSGSQNDTSDTDYTLTLSAFDHAKNAAYGAVYQTAVVTITVGSGFTQLSNQASTHSFQTEHKENDNTVDWSFSAGGDRAAIALELAVAPVGFFSVL